MKKFVSIALCGAFLASGIVGFAGCGESSLPFRVWGPSAQQDSLKQMVAAFKEANPDITYDIEVGVCGEGDAYSQMSNDPQSGADVFAFANDQLVNLFSIGVLSPLSPSTVTALTASEDATALASGKLGENHYGYPYAADNGFFLYYDSSVVSEEQAKTVEGVLEACAAKDKAFIFEGTNSWYALSFAYGAGGKYEVTYDGTVVSKVECNLDEKPDGGEYSYGQLGGFELASILQDKVTKVGDDTLIDNCLNDNSFGACIRGTWKGDAIASALGDHYAATVLPSWTGLDGETYPWYSFAGCKLYGVNAYSKHIEDAHRLAAFLTSPTMQEKRFDDNAIGPSNKAVAALQKVQDNIAVSTMMKQIATASVIQTSMPSNYWSEADAFGQSMQKFDLNSSADDLQDLVVQMVATFKSAAAPTT